MRIVEHLSSLLLAVSAAALAATAFLFFEFRRGAGLEFHVEMALAALLALVVPLSVVAIYDRLRPGKRPFLSYFLFALAALAIAGGFLLAAR